MASEQSHQQQLQQQQGLQRQLPEQLLGTLRVRTVDWRTALAAAPLPCSARQNLSALSSGHARALSYHLSPLLLPAVTRVLLHIAAAQLPWQGPMEAALAAAAKYRDIFSGSMEAGTTAGQEAEQQQAFEAALIDLGVVEAPISRLSGQQMHA